MSTLVERLRARADWVGYPKGDLTREAADRIEALEGALRPALVELIACSVQLKARNDGSIARAIDGIRAALEAKS
jgi:hypothetical protein